MPRSAPPHLYVMGAGAVTSTARDMSRLLRAMGNGGVLDGTRILLPASVEAMQTPPAGVPSDGYGFGWLVGTHNGTRIGWHTGAAATSSGSMALTPELRRGFVLLTNQQHLLDSMISMAELEQGMVDLIAGRAPGGSRVSIRDVGLGPLTVLAVVLALLARPAARVGGAGSST